jgi:Tfp pilus assembly protein PilX
MIFILVFAALAVSMASLSGVNLQIADNQRKVNSALSAAQSGLQAGCYLANKYSSGAPLQTSRLLNQADKDATWTAFCTYLQNNTVGGAAWSGTGNERSSSISLSNSSKIDLMFNYDGNSIFEICHRQQRANVAHRQYNHIRRCLQPLESP